MAFRARARFVVGAAHIPIPDPAVKAPEVLYNRTFSAVAAAVMDIQRFRVSKEKRLVRFGRHGIPWSLEGSNPYFAARACTMSYPPLNGFPR